MMLLFNFIGPEILIIGFALLLVVPWIWTIIDVIKSDFKKSGDKPLFLVLTLAFPLIGTLIYHFHGRKQKLIQTSEYVDSPKI